MYTIYWLKSIDGIKLRFKRSVRTAWSVKLEELCREVAESFASRRRGGSRGKKRGCCFESRTKFRFATSYDPKLS